MTKLKKPLYITYSNQRARDIRRKIASSQPFAQITTLSQIMLELFEEHDNRTLLLDPLIPSVVLSIIRETEIYYFSYLKPGDDGLEQIAALLLKCAANRIDLSDLYSGEKRDALSTIQSKYEEFKQENGLADNADVESSVLSFLHTSDKYFHDYHGIYIDYFQKEELHFYTSKIQKECVDLLSERYKMIPVSDIADSTAKLYTPSKRAFDNVDEVRQALKIARKLLLDGVGEEEILIVTSDISEYAPIFRLQLENYGLKGYDSRGIPLSHFKGKLNKGIPRVADTYGACKERIHQTQSQAEKLGITVNEDDIKKHFLESTYVQSEKMGIQLTETNQLVGTSRRYEHILFIGTDIDHFPPKIQDNFLISASDAVKHFCTNDYYINSKVQLRLMQQLANNLYVITARYKNGRPLAPSLLIPHIENTIDLSDIVARDEVFETGKLAIPSREAVPFIHSLKSADFSSFDGKGVEGISAKPLSASQLNSYTNCPLKYLYQNKVDVSAPRSTEEGFDFAEEGNLMHLCFEYFGKAIRAGEEEDSLNQLMYNISNRAYEEYQQKEKKEPNIYHELFLSTLQAGLVDSRDKGLLARFVSYFKDNRAAFDNFKHSEFEKKFLLDENLAPTDDAKNYFIRGFIDRFDNTKEHVSIIDYKSKKVKGKKDKNDIQTRIKEFKDYQLALYILYAEQVTKDKPISAHLLTFKGDKEYSHFASLGTEHQNDSICYDDEYRRRLKDNIHKVKASIEAGDFAFNDSDEKQCGYCDIKHLCHHTIVNKGVDCE
ncbi:PD-(D/E)XK nuclease family protein [Chitinivibrio alkaliphilus]|uniref:PD-(D/E)XK endonuclease-like domain-containing protein n=1 Tax=Chitinivibrio alkaliphilus ACht1 TaxID=1313304 RepID=U7D557_9BACT|nr:PD-(D/E)XK nuclease family protein [Chitinivibrio alkaliphilus]ERP30701.1 hypothetical protein CALK_2481 [Chitinivibrio alkaliphilus ACht1]